MLPSFVKAQKWVTKAACLVALGTTQPEHDSKLQAPVEGSNRDQHRSGAIQTIHNLL